MSAHVLARTAHAMLACAVAFVATACGERVDEHVDAIVEFRTDSAAPDYGAVDIVGVGGEALKALRRARPNGSVLRSMLTVHANDTAGVAMLGTYAILDDRVRFVPAFPPVPGNTYVARFDAGAFSRAAGRPAKSARSEWTVGRNTSDPTTVVEAIYPTTDTVPMNLLKLYLHFSAPMSVGESMRRVRVVDASGTTIEDVFLVPAGGTELWDPDRRRLTMFFDPGRIKRDLRPNEEVGLPLRSGRRYRVLVDSAWPDATGRPLRRAASKTLIVRDADRAAPNTAGWTVRPPKSGTRDSLVVLAGEPMDQALLSRMITVHKSNGAEIRGTSIVADAERRWVFVPSEAWPRGSYYLQVDTDLEDLAGNSLKKLFDMGPGDVEATREEFLRVRFVVE